MRNILKEWFDINYYDISKKGFRASYYPGELPDSGCVNIDSTKTVGTISFWPEHQFEFHFFDCVSGDVLLMLEISLTDKDSLAAFFNDSILPKIV